MSINYQRSFPHDIPGADDSGVYLYPKEVKDADEDALMAQIRDATVADTHRLPKHAGKNDPAFNEPHWGHTTGLVQGTLALDRITALPEPFRVGLFAKNQSLPVVSRPNLIHDRKAGFSVGRLSLKIQYPDAVPNVYAAGATAHELDLLFAEGSPEVNGLGHTFFFRDARELAMFTTLKPPSMNTVKTLLAPRNWGHIGRVFKAIK